MTLNVKDPISNIIISENEVKNSYISDIKVSKDSGPDDNPNKILRALSPIMS